MSSHIANWCLWAGKQLFLNYSASTAASLAVIYMISMFVKSTQDPEGSWHIICTLHSGWCVRYSSKDHEECYIKTQLLMEHEWFSSNTATLESHQLCNEVTHIGVAIQYILPRWPDMSFRVFLSSVPSHSLISTLSSSRLRCRGLCQLLAFSQVD